jgi:hypothetical protein
LCDATPASFADAMAKIAADSGDGDFGSKARRMGVLARQRVEWKFSRKAFGNTMLGLMPGLLAEAREKRVINARRTENVVVVVLVVATATIVRALLGALVAFFLGAVF